MQTRRPLRLDSKDVFERHPVDHWVFGGWAVDFHAGSVTRPHYDVDLAAIGR